MRLVVDSSSVISLHMGEVLERLFDLTPEVFTTDLTANELEEPPADRLIQMGLTVYSLRDAELSEAEQLASENASVSLQDTSVIVLARRLGAIVLADDKPLRELAQSKGLQVHGSLWVLEQLAFHQLITASVLCEAIRKMLRSGRRLPLSIVSQMRRQYRCKQD